MTKLSVVIIARNEEHNMPRCLESVKPVADEIVVVDSMSADRTASLCREFGCKVFLREFDGYGTQKQFAVDQASNDWILSVDADEILSEELQNEINLLFRHNPHPGVQIPQSAYNIPFSLYFMGRILRHGSVGKEVHLRLFNRTLGRFTRVPVHEGIDVTGSTGTLKGRIIHYSYRDISHHLEKINTYTSQAAEGYHDRGRTFSKFMVALKFPTSFISNYFFRLGFLDGYPGFMWSFLAAVYSTLKVAKTIELTKKS